MNADRFKAVRTLDSAHEAQLINYLKATNIEAGLLLQNSKDLYMIIKEKISVMISVDRWLSSYQNSRKGGNSVCKGVKSIIENLGGKEILKVQLDHAEAAVKTTRLNLKRR